MRSFTVIILIVTFMALVSAEPPRRRFSFRSFARQEEAAEQQPQGYNYEAPAESRRLRLPEKLRLKPFARQEEQSSGGGYNYPKPTDSYGPPDSPPEATTTTELPSEYGTPDESTSTDFPSTDEPESTTNPQVETLRSLQATQFRRQNAKLARISKQKPKQSFQLKSQALFQPQQIVYVAEYPHADLIEEPEELVYIFKK
jgi:hypothetical protein